MRKIRFGSEKNISINLSEGDLVWLVQMMAQVKVNTVCQHCEDEAVEKGCIFLDALSPEARNKAMMLAETEASRVVLARNAPASESIN